VSPDDSCVVTGDTGGHIRVWDVSPGLECGSPAAARAGFKPDAHWRAHEGAVAGLDFVKGGPCPLVISAGRDSNVALWTLEGGLVGVLGEASWSLGDRSTWADPDGRRRRPPLEPDQGVFLRRPAAGRPLAGREAGEEGPWCGDEGGRGSGKTGGGDAAGVEHFNASAWVDTRWAGCTGQLPVGEGRGSGGDSCTADRNGDPASPLPPGRATAEFFSDGVALAAAAAAAGRHDFGGVPLAQLMLQVGGGGAGRGVRPL
jgi:hypothetical protein